MSSLVRVEPAHCDHVRAYYQYHWERRPCIAFNLLRWGYRQWAEGLIAPGVNNLFGHG